MSVSEQAATSLGPVTAFYGDEGREVFQALGVKIHIGAPNADAVRTPVGFRASFTMRLLPCEANRWRRLARQMLDRRRYNRARRKAVRAVLSGLAARHATPRPSAP